MNIKTPEQKLTEAIATADEMAATFRGQIERQKAGMTRLIEERQQVIELLKEADSGQLSADATAACIKKALAVMHVKPAN